MLMGRGLGEAGFWHWEELRGVGRDFVEGGASVPRFGMGEARES